MNKTKAMKKPIEPRKPVMPNSVNTVCHEFEIYDNTSITDIERSLHDKWGVEVFDYRNLKLLLKEDYSDYYSSSCRYSMHAEYSFAEENKNYEFEMQKYAILLNKYNQDLIEYNNKLAEYCKFEKEKELDELRKRLAKLEKEVSK